MFALIFFSFVLSLWLELKQKCVTIGFYVCVWWSVYD